MYVLVEIWVYVNVLLCVVEFECVIYGRVFVRLCVSVYICGCEQMYMYVVCVMCVHLNVRVSLYVVCVLCM